MSSWIVAIVFLFTGVLTPIGIIMLIGNLMRSASASLRSDDGEVHAPRSARTSPVYAEDEKREGSTNYNASAYADSNAENATDFYANIRKGEQKMQSALDSLGEVIGSAAAAAGSAVGSAVGNAAEAVNKATTTAGTNAAAAASKAATQAADTASKVSANAKAETTAERFDKNRGKKRGKYPLTPVEREAKVLKRINGWLIGAMIACFGTAIPCVSVGIPFLVVGNPDCIPLLIVSAVFGSIGLSALGVNRKLFGRLKLRRRYLKVVGDSQHVDVALLSRSLGRSESAVRREIEAMIDDGYFGEGAYFDYGLDALVLDAATVRDMHETVSEVADAPEIAVSEYDRILRELRTLDAKIEDSGISAKIERIGVTCAKIFEIVKSEPDKLPQIRRFMNYYLPTTLKLLRSYVTLEKQGITGDNIEEAKENINRVLSALADGYDKQLDQLFRTDVLDIGADIEVLESMLASDGLAAESPFKTQESPFKMQTSTGEII